MRTIITVALAFALGGCATYHDELLRGQQDYEKNEHEKALAVFRALEPDQSHFDDAEEARYAYLRGMTDYRIGYRADARHWLMIAKAIEDEHKDSIPKDWAERLKSTLGELNDEVFGGGMAALGNDGKKTKSEEPLKPVKKSEDEP